LCGGSQREERGDVLASRIEETGMDPKDYWWYLELRKYGSVPHAGLAWASSG
jgi:asparaginyl-tRNA synthetase